MLVVVMAKVRYSQTAGRNSCLIVSIDVSNCSYRLTEAFTSLRLSSTKHFFIREKHRIPIAKTVYRVNAC